LVSLLVLYSHVKIGFAVTGVVALIKDSFDELFKSNFLFGFNNPEGSKCSYSFK